MAAALDSICLFSNGGPGGNWHTHARLVPRGGSPAEIAEIAETGLVSDPNSANSAISAPLPPGEAAYPKDSGLLVTKPRLQIHKHSVIEDPEARDDLRSLPPGCGRQQPQL
jgi:hypothetical protein